MEEKKLTDEEIVKDIERSTGMPSYWKKIVLDLIHRLQRKNERIQEISREKSKAYYAVAQTCAVQEETIANQKAEIERLTEALNKQRNLYLKEFGSNANALAKNAELQKQVDELLRDKGFLIADLTNARQAVKDTARGILQELWDETIKDGIPAVYCMLTPKEIKDRAKRYGVEVEW